MTDYVFQRLERIGPADLRLVVSAEDGSELVAVARTVGLGGVTGDDVWKRLIASPAGPSLARVVQDALGLTLAVTASGETGFAKGVTEIRIPDVSDPSQVDVSQVGVPEAVEDAQGDAERTLILTNVKAAVVNSGHPVESFAGIAGLDPEYFADALAGRKNFGYMELLRVSEVSTVSVEELLGAAPSTSGVAGRRGDKPASSGFALDLAREIEGRWEDLAAIGYSQQPRLPNVPVLSGSLRQQGEALAAFVLDVLRENDIDVLAANLPAEIERVFGIDVAIQELGQGFDGLAVTAASSRFILINNAQQVGRLRFTLAHELCHILLADAQQVHWDENVYSANIESEVRANAFASALLMPEAQLREAVTGSVDALTALRLSVRYQVSPSAMLVRLGQLNVIDGLTKDRLGETSWRRLASQHGLDDSHIVASASDVKAPMILAAAALNAYRDGATTLRPYAAITGVRDIEALRSQLLDEVDLREGN